MQKGLFRIHHPLPAGRATDCTLRLNIGIGMLAINGWYPESSRCDSGRATHIRLGPGDAINQQCS
jgi:hypothetical protein